MLTTYPHSVRFFPHQVEDLSTALSCLSPSADPAVLAPSEWAYRYVVLLWLSLITKIPFDLVRFDDGDTLPAQEDSGRGGLETATATATAQKLENLGKKYLQFPGMEGIGASLLLSGLYTRYAISHLPCHRSYPKFQLHRATLSFCTQPRHVVAAAVLIASAATSIEANADSFSVRIKPRRWMYTRLMEFFFPDYWYSSCSQPSHQDQRSRLHGALHRIAQFDDCAHQRA